MRALFRSRTCLFLTFGLLVILAPNAKAQQSTDSAALRAAVSVRIDSRTPLYDEANDRGAARAVEQVGTFMHSFELQVSRGSIEAAKQSIDDLFSLLPIDDASFVSFITTSPRNAPTLVASIRSAVTKASELSVDSPALRTLFLERVGEAMKSHIELTALHGPAFLQLFNRWTYAIVSWRYLAGDPRTSSTTRENLLNYARSLSTDERQLLAQNDSIYRHGFANMMCTRMFTPSR